MVDPTIQHKYISLVGDSLEGFKRLRGDVFNFRCPICGDSERKNKKRGYLIHKHGEYLFYCHNCGNSMGFPKFLSEVDNALYREYRKEVLLANKRTFDKKEAGFTVEKWKIEKRYTQSVASLDDDHPAKKYLRWRKVPESKFASVQWTDDFPALVGKTIGDKYNGVKLPKEGIVFELKELDGTLTGYQIRSIDTDCPKSQRFVICSINEDHGFYYQSIDKTKPLYIVEGCTDSLFIENSVAVLSSSLCRLHFSDSDVYFNDQEPRNKEVCKQIEKCIEKGYKVVLLPHEFEGMDVNDIVKAGIPPEKLHLLFERYTYKGLAAKIQFAKWRK